MSGRTRKVYEALCDCPQDIPELSVGTRLTGTEVLAGLRELMRDEKVVDFTDNGVVMYRVVA